MEKINLNEHSRPFKTLLTPIRIGGVELKNRIAMAPTSNHMCKDGVFTEREANFFLTRARGGVGLIVVGATYIDRFGGGGEDLGLSDDKFIPHFQSFTKEAHKYGTKLSIQLYHLGRYAGRHPGSHEDFQPVAPSPIPWPPGNIVPHELTVKEIAEIVKGWTEAAGRAKRAGFDMVEIHAAHGYLSAQFLSPHANKRKDAYGGNFEGRSRFLREVVGSCREALGSNFPISVRLSGAEFVEGGLTVEDQKQTACLLEEIGVDLISVSAGLSPLWGHTRCIPGMFYEPGLNVPLAEAIKGVVKVPVMVTGRLHDPYLAEQVLASGKADLIGMARQLICDPDYVNKLNEGRSQEIRGCISCNNCHNRSLDDRSTRCLLNVEAGREMKLKITPAPKKKRVLVAGGGPAGMEAARVARLRGHEVVLYEKDGQLGGRLRLASIPPHKSEYLGAVEYLEKAIKRLGVRIKLHTEITKTTIQKEKPDAVVLACGSTIAVPCLPGIDSPHVTTADDVLAGRTKVGRRVLVIGGGSVGAETAHYMAAQGKKVIIIEMLPEIVPQMIVDFRYHLLTRLSELGVEVMCNTTVSEIRKDTVRLNTPKGEQILKEIETVVVATGGKPNNSLEQELNKIPLEVRVIGDAQKPEDGVKAVYDGYMAGYEM